MHVKVSAIYTESSQETYAEGLFPIEKRKQATTIEDIINWKPSVAISNSF